jgi:hypothetical protein
MASDRRTSNAKIDIEMARMAQTKQKPEGKN